MYKRIAKDVVINNLGAGGTPEGLSDIYDIKAGDDELLLRHLKALRNIFDKAIKEMIAERKK